MRPPRPFKVIMESASSRKAIEYSDELDQARSRGDWGDILRLCDKVEKHAPNRKLYCWAARLEFRIQLFNSGSKHSQNTEEQALFQEALHKTKDLAAKHTQHDEDLLQAKFAIVWALFWQREYAAVLQLTKHEIPSLLKSTLAKGPTNAWTSIASLKCDYANARVLELDGRKKKAAEAYLQALENPKIKTSGRKLDKGYLMWQERLVIRACEFNAREVMQQRSDFDQLLSKDASILPSKVLLPFRQFHSLMSGAATSLWNEQLWMESDQKETRNDMWRAYFNVLSIILQARIPLPCFNNAEELLAEVSSIEAKQWEVLQIGETFPAANSRAPLIAEWAYQLTANWQSVIRLQLIGVEISPGRRLEWTERLITLLQKATGLTNEPEQILRYLLVAHAAMGDIILTRNVHRQICHTFSIYTEESGIEACIESPSRKFLKDFRSLCTATTVSCKFSGDLYSEPDFIATQTLIRTVVDSWQTGRGSRIPQALISEGARTLGFAKLQIALHCHDPARREKMLDGAIARLHFALSDQLRQSYDLQALSLLSFSFICQNKLDVAIAVMEVALAKDARPEFYDDMSPFQPLADSFRRSPVSRPEQRCLLLKCVHTLVLLKSAKGDYEKATGLISAAFELYGGEATLQDTTWSPTSMFWSIDERFELVQLKMTQIAVIAAMPAGRKSPPGEEAVNMLEDLTRMYGQLIDQPNLDAEGSASSQPNSPASSTKYKRKGFRQSLLNFSRIHKQEGSKASSKPASPTETSIPVSRGVPYLAVDGEKESPLPIDSNHYHGFLGRHESKKLKKRLSHKSLEVSSKDRINPPAPQIASTKAGPSDLRLPATAYKPDQTKKVGDYSNPHSPDEIGVAMTHDLPLEAPTSASKRSAANPVRTIPSAAENMDHENPNTQPIPPNPHLPYVGVKKEIKITNDLDMLQVPGVQYVRPLEERRRLIFGSTFWVFVASVFYHANSFVQGDMAILEAKKHQRSLQDNIAQNEGLFSISLKGEMLPGQKSYNELCADSLAEEANGKVKQISASDKSETQRDLQNAALELYQSALCLCQDHLRATVGLASLYFDVAATAQSPTYVKSFLEGCGVVPLRQPNGTAVLKNQPKLPSPKLSDAFSRRSLFFPTLRRVARSYPGCQDAEALHVLAIAYQEYSYDPESISVFETLAEMECPVRPFSILMENH